jgi:GTPase
MTEFRAGFVAIVGAPNAGKSTLLNAFAGQKIAIVSAKPQTTRGRMLGIVDRKDHQIAFIDTPGVREGKNALGKHMASSALRAIEDGDVTLLLVDAAARAEGKGDAGEDAAIERLKRSRKPAVLVLNKIDRLGKPKLLPLIEAYRSRYPFSEIFPISALKGEGVGELYDALAKLIPPGERLFPPETLTDQAERAICAELIREQLLHLLRDEVPHSIAVVVDEFDETERSPSSGPKGPRPGLVRIQAVIYVERESQKGIVIGKRGQMLKAIGTAARERIERFLSCRVFLGLVVRVQPNWTDDERALTRFGIVREDG